MSICVRVSVSEKIVVAQSLRDEAQSLVEDKPKKAAVKFRTVFAYTKGLIPQTSELAVYAVATGQQTVIDGEQQGGWPAQPFLDASTRSASPVVRGGSR